MAQAENNVVANGNLLIVSGDFDLRQPYTALRMPDGKVVRLLTTQLTQAALDDHISKTGDVSEPILIPVIEERLEIGRRTIATETVRLRKVAQEYQESVDETLAVRTFDIERVTLNRPIDTPPPIRQEGCATIYSIVEEQMILTKQLILKEEVRVTQRDTERRDTQVVSLKREHLVVERKATVRQPQDRNEAS